jgi:hypothetical protein
MWTPRGSKTTEEEEEEGRGESIGGYIDSDYTIANALNIV